MTPAFLDKQLRERYEKIVFSWKGTPYRHLVCSKGRGADCTLLVGACLKELGVLKKIEHEYYPRHWHFATKKEWVIESFYHHINNHLRNGWVVTWQHEKIPMEKFMFGDVITFATTSMGVSNHCGIWIDKGRYFFNSAGKRGCCVLTYGSFWDKRQTGLLRLWKED